MNMNHIDITFDMETCATTANAAVMQVAAVAWNRSAKENPFSVGDGSAVAFDYSGIPDAPPNIISFNEHIDLRTCVVDGFDFDQATVKWWANQTDKAKKAVTDGLAEPIEEVFIRFIEWINKVKKDTKAESVCLWCQGMDFDAAILRNICHKYDLELPSRYQQFRDCRTLILETAVMQVSRYAVDDSCGMICDDGSIIKPKDILQQPCKAYKIYKPLPEEIIGSGVVHDAMYDCIRSSWNTWQALGIINECLITPAING